MANMVRKRFFILLLVCSFLLTGCFSEHVSSRTVGKRAEEYMKCFADKDEEKLFSYFAEDIKTNRKELTMTEIKEAFNSVIDGNIVSYRYGGSGGGGESVDYGKIKKFYRSPEFYDVKTDTGKSYEIKFSYHHIWREYPEREGLREINIYQTNDSGKEFLFRIVDNYDPDN